MKVYELRDPQRLRVRAHPWVDADGDPRHRYHDLRRHPEHIRTRMEDLVPWRDHPAIETFFQLLEWLNGPGSVLESNDCAFSGPSANVGPHSALPIEVSGRLMVLFRELGRNLRSEEVQALTQHVARALSVADPSLDAAVIGASVVEVQFTDLPGPPARQQGSQLMLSFWAWGDDDAQAYRNLDRTLTNLGGALRTVA